MSEATKRKHVTQEVVHGDVEICKNQFIVRVLESKGNNLHLVEDELSHSTLCSMPPKFRKNVWIKKGDFLIVESIKEGKKVTCEVVSILYPPQIEDLKADDLWPDAFTDAPDPKAEDSKEFTSYRTPKTPKGDSESSSDDSLEGNVNQINRPVVYMSDSGDSSEDGDSR